MLPILRKFHLLDQLAALGITNRRITRVAKFAEVREDSGLSEKQREQFRFAPSPEVVFLEGSEDLWFRSRGSNWATVFVLLPDDLVLLTAEYVTGAEIIIIAHCAGQPEKGETMEQCVIREAREESGIILGSAHSLSSAGLPVSARKSTERVFPFVGYPALHADGRVMFEGPKPDENERIVPFVMPLRDYWDFIGTSYGNTVAGRDCAYAALRHLGKLRLA